jgi:hypothetical protein
MLSFTGHFCLGWWSNFVGSEPGQKQSVRRKREEEVREKLEGQQYTHIVPSSMGATVPKLGRKYLP